MTLTDEQWIKASVELFEDAERALRDEGYDHLANKIHFHISGEKELQALMDEGVPPTEARAE